MRSEAGVSVGDLGLQGVGRVVAILYGRIYILNLAHTAVQARVRIPALTGVFRDHKKSKSRRFLIRYEFVRAGNDRILRPDYIDIIDNRLTRRFDLTYDQWR